MSTKTYNNIGRRKTIGHLTRSLLSALILLALSGLCHADYNVWANEYTFGQQELQTVISREFPRTLIYKQLFEVTLSNPRLRMNPQSNRLISIVDVRIDNKLVMPKSVNGTISMSSTLKYDAATQSIRLEQPLVEKVEFNGLPPQFAAQLNAIGNVTAEQILKNYPIYNFKPEQLELNGKRFEPGAITIVDNGIKIDIKPL